MPGCCQGVQVKFRSVFLFTIPIVSVKPHVTPHGRLEYLRLVCQPEIFKYVPHLVFNPSWWDSDPCQTVAFDLFTFTASGVQTRIYSNSRDVSCNTQVVVLRAPLRRCWIDSLSLGWWPCNPFYSMWEGQRVRRLLRWLTCYEKRSQ